MRESDLRRLIQMNLPQVHWQSIETGGTGLGVPDLNGCHKGVEFWIELKLVKRGLLCGLSPTQVAWHMRRQRAGGNTWFLVRKASQLFLYHGADASALKDAGLRLTPRLSWLFGMDWNELLKEVTR